MTEALKLGELHDLPASLDLITAAAVLGIGRTKAYELAKRDEFPCGLRRIGGTYRVITTDLLRYLGIEPLLSA